MSGKLLVSIVGIFDILAFFNRFPLLLLTDLLIVLDLQIAVLLIEFRLR